MSTENNWSVERSVAPSILSADFGALRSQVSDVLDAGAKVIHVDVMDGHFVPPITFGSVAVDAIAELVHAAGAKIDVHLMIEHPERYAEEFAKAGADGITVHYEATPHVNYALQTVRAAGCRAGLALCPATPADVVVESLEAVDLVLCMSVNPGWGNQTLIEHSYTKLARLRELLPGRVGLEVDGGVHDQTAGRVAAAGANLLVAGSAVFGSEDPGRAFRELQDATWG